MATIFKKEEFKKKLDLQTQVNIEDRTDFFTAHEPSGIVAKEVLDAQSKARALLEEAKKEASILKQEAKEILSQVKEERERERQTGEKRGYEEGLQKALEQLQKLQLLKEKMFQNIEPQLVKLAFSIAEKVIGAAVKEHEGLVLSVVSQALEDMQGQKITIRVHPDDYQKLRSHEAMLLNKVGKFKSLLFKEDETITVGGCVVESEVGTLDARLETQLTAIRKALGEET